MWIMIIVNPCRGVYDKGVLTIEVMTQLAAHRRPPIWTHFGRAGLVVSH